MAVSCSSLVAPCRLLSFFLSVPKSSGMCRNSGTGAPERLVDDDLLGRVADVVVAADDVRDLHGDVVDHHGEVVGDGAVAALHDEVADGVVVELHRAAQQVVERRSCPAGTRMRSVNGSPAALRRSTSSARERPALARVHPGALLGLRRLPLGLELLRRAEARVQVAAREQLLDVLVVDGLALGLPVRAVRARDLGALVPLQPHLAHGADDLQDRLVGAAREVGVLDAQDERRRRGCARRCSCTGRCGRCPGAGSPWGTGRSARRRGPGACSVRCSLIGRP